MPSAPRKLILARCDECGLPFDPRTSISSTTCQRCLERTAGQDFVEMLTDMAEVGK